MSAMNKLLWTSTASTTPISIFSIRTFDFEASLRHFGRSRDWRRRVTLYMAYYLATVASRAIPDRSRAVKATPTRAKLTLDSSRVAMYLTESSVIGVRAAMRKREHDRQAVEQRKRRNASIALTIATAAANEPANTISAPPPPSMQAVEQAMDGLAVSEAAPSTSATPPVALDSKMLGYFATKNEFFKFCRGSSGGEA